MTQVSFIIDIEDESLAGEHDLILSIGLNDYPTVNVVDSTTFKATLH